MKPTFRSFYIITSFIFAISVSLFSQEKTVNVERCEALDQSSPIHNIWVDNDNIKWVANSNGLNKVLDLLVVEKVPVPAGITSLLTIRGGNAQVEWSTAAMQQLIGNVNITCAFYNSKSKTVWIGTKESGAIEVALSPLRVIQTLNTDNRKLTSNQINDIFIRSNGTIYIATNDGMLTGSGDKWTLLERYLNFVGVDAWGDNLWILGDNFLWQVDNKGKWNPVAIELRNVEGRMSDIAVDDEGRVWIASNMMTGYDVEAEKYQRFGPGQYFTSQFVNCLDVDQDGSIWTGTADKGLYLIQWESSLILTFSVDTPLDCKGSTATISVKVAGGQAPYNYQWSNGQTTPKITQLSKGEYLVTVTDVNGLIKTGKYELPDPSISVNVVDVKPSTSPQGNGSANLIVNGGTGQYVYTWDNGEVLPAAVKLVPGNHTVTVTDKSGCSSVATVSVPETVSALDVSVITVKENKCGNSTEGELRAEVRGGKEPYQYAWSSNNSKEAVLSSLGAGTYTISITDAAGQTTTANAVLATPAPLVATIQIILPANVNTSNGQAQAKASGGKAPYTYQWENGETNAINKTLAPGPNKLTVTDANGCTSIATVNMTENITEMNASITQAGEITCHDGSTGLSVEVTGGKGPYKFNWTDGQQTQAITNVKAGNYVVTVTDVSGGIVSANIKIDQPSPIALTVQINGAATSNASDGSATVKAIGGTGIYNFTWDNGEKSNKATKLGEGKHKVTVTDGAGCSEVAEIEISENILALQASIEQVNEIKCAGDPAASLNAVVTGGKDPYTYLWSNDATSTSLSSQKEGLFTLTVTDAMGHTATTAISVGAPYPLVVDVKVESSASANGSNGRAIATVTGGKGKYTYAWDNGEKTARAEKLNAGTHTLTVTDENGCVMQSTVVITENILPLASEIIHSGSIPCAGQKGISLTASVTGGKEPYTYLWDAAGQSYSSSTLSDVGAGTYALKVTDATGNVSMSLFEVTEPKPLQIAVDKTSPASTGNADGEVTLKVSGGTLPYSFRNTALPNTTTLIEIDQLSPGTHTMVVTDASGCTASTSVNITEDILPLTVSIKEARALTCAGVANGSLEVSAKGGKPPYIYTWSDGTLGATVENVAAGKYVVTVKDATGLESKAEYIFKAPEPMIVEVVNLRSATNDRISDGKGSVEIKGGTAPFAYTWSSGETSSIAGKLPLGQGRVIVTDQNGCTATAEYLVKEKVLAELTAERLASGEPIRMEKIQFRADSVKVEAEAIPSLDELYEFLYDHPTTIIEVAGHTNGLPADEYCDRISTERAKSVADYLINKGIESRRVISKGYGKRKPIAPNQTPEGRKKNQRVEIRLIKIEE